MQRETTKRCKALILVLTVLSPSVTDTRAESLSIDDATVIQETVSRNAAAGLATAAQKPRYRQPCNAKRRALVGAAIGFVAGMVAVRKAAESNDGTVDTKGKLQAGAYGAVLGLGIGLATCR